MKHKFLNKHKVAITIIGIIAILLFMNNYFFGIKWWRFIPFKEKCGGWNAWEGETICKCSGILVKSGCPPITLCDGGTYYCLFGKCEECQEAKIE